MRRSDWRLVAGAAVVQVVTACALRVMSLPALRRFLARLGPLAVFMLNGAEDRVVWAVEATGRRLSRVGLSTCLVRAIVADLGLSSPERPLQLTIGVKRAGSGRLQSHAWLADRDRILVGGQSAGEFLPLVAWDSVRV